jgi:hypothetical protein
MFNFAAYSVKHPYMLVFSATIIAAINTVCVIIIDMRLMAVRLQ